MVFSTGNSPTFFFFFSSTVVFFQINTTETIQLNMYLKLVYLCLYSYSFHVIVPPPPPQWSRGGNTGFAMAVRPSVPPSVCPWTQFCPEFFSYSFPHTALKFIHNVCVHMKMCNFHDHTIISCGIISPWTFKFYWIIVVRSFSPTVFHVLLWNLYIMFVSIGNFAYEIFMTILSLVMELSPFELVNFTELLLSGAFVQQFSMYCSEIYT